MVEDWRSRLFYCLFRTRIYTTVTTATLSNYRQKDVIIKPAFLNFARFQKLRLLTEYTLVKNYHFN
jgi:hypothetical protein